MLYHNASRQGRNTYSPLGGLGMDAISFTTFSLPLKSMSFTNVFKGSRIQPTLGAST